MGRGGHRRQARGSSPLPCADLHASSNYPYVNWLVRDESQRDTCRLPGSVCYPFPRQFSVGMLAELRQSFYSSISCHILAISQSLLSFLSFSHSRQLSPRRLISSCKMRFSTCLSILALAAGIASAGRSLQHVGKKDLRAPKVHRRTPQPDRNKRAESSLNPQYLSKKSSRKLWILGVF